MMMGVPKRVVLIGLPMSGKSTMGKWLSRTLSYFFGDLDEAVCHLGGWKSMREAFSQKGEGEVRKVEKQALSDFLKKEGSWILATGSGAVCHADSLRMVCERAYVLHLSLSWEALSMRIRTHPQACASRPLLRGRSWTPMQLQARFGERLKYYKRAHYTLHDRGETISEKGHRWLQRMAHTKAAYDGTR